MSRRKHCRSGSIQLEARKTGSSVWIYRYWEKTGGDRRRRKVILGTVEELPTQEDADRAAEPYRRIANAEDANAVPPPTIEALIGRYEKTKLPERPKLATKDTPVPETLEMSTHCADSYRSVIKCWIRPRWLRRNDGSPYLVRDFEHITMSTSIEDWLVSLVRSNKNPKGLARKSVRHIFAVMKVIFKHAVKWGYLKRSPMGNKYEKLVELPRGSTRRMRPPVQLTPAGYLILLEALDLLGLLAVAVAGWLGPRRSEGFGLKWSNIDFLNRKVEFTQGMVEGRVSALKTEASAEELPLPDQVAQLLLGWRRLTPYREPNDWVFASPYTNGERPYWPGQLMKSHIRPVAEKLGLGRIGWHSFRHSSNAWGKAAGLAAPALKGLLRDESDSMVNQVYGTMDIEAKREAMERVHAYVKRTAAAAAVAVKEGPKTVQ
jgi:integrase